MPDKWRRIKSGDERESQSYDETYRLAKVGIYGWDGTQMVQLMVDSNGAFSTNYALRLIVDSGDANIKYLGKAIPGTLTSAAEWQVQKLDETGGDTVITWADGDADFDNIFDNRESLSYS